MWKQRFDEAIKVYPWLWGIKSHWNYELDSFIFQSAEDLKQYLCTHIQLSMMQLWVHVQRSGGVSVDSVTVRGHMTIPEAVSGVALGEQESILHIVLVFRIPVIGNRECAHMTYIFDQPKEGTLMDIMKSAVAKASATAGE